MDHRISRSEYLQVQGLKYHVRHWGPQGAPMLFLLHGWMDSSPTFQFLVDALHNDWHVVAPDWRGFGHSEWLGRPYWFPDYYADLEAVLDHYTPDQPARLIGHSMGAGIASTFAGARPQRVSHLVMLDFLGLKPNPEEDAPRKIRTWLDALKAPPALRAYPNFEALARRLASVNARLTPDRADFLARHVGVLNDQGLVEMACDPWHKAPSPAVYRMEDALAVWSEVQARTLMLMADVGFVRLRFSGDEAAYQRCLSCFTQLQAHSVRDCGHNMQHDQPEYLASVIEDFLAQTD